MAPGSACVEPLRPDVSRHAAALRGRTVRSGRTSCRANLLSMIPKGWRSFGSHHAVNQKLRARSDPVGADRALEAVPDPAAHSREVAVGSRSSEKRRTARLEIFDMRNLRVDEEADYRR